MCSHTYADHTIYDSLQGPIETAYFELRLSEAKLGWTNLELSQVESAFQVEQKVRAKRLGL